MQQTRTWKPAILLLGASFAVCAAAADPSDLARRAAHGDAAAVAELRATGPSGIEEMLALANEEPGVGESPAFQEALDAVCAQRDCAASHLYWYTDLAAAREAAERSGRPILSLRLLGRLDEELSCANSRFFRAVLYANETVSQALRDRFVLVWQSERPVPKVTVDFGDGRRLEGTITGNSIHYVLDPHGRLVDALPGLYGPQAFLQALGRAEAEAKRLAEVPDPEFAGQRAQYHRDRFAALKKALTQDLRELGVEAPEIAASTTLYASRWGGGEPIYSAIRASRLALTKSAVEMPLLSSLSLGPRAPEPAEITPVDVGDLHRDEAALDDASRRLLQKKLVSWVGPLSLDQSFGRFEELLAEDTVRNEYLLHGKLHNWLAAETAATSDPIAFNARVYRELFLTPGWDPWLGLAPREVYSVLTPAPGSVVEPPPPPVADVPLGG